MRLTESARSVALAVALLGWASLQGGELVLLDKPLWIFPGQTFRIAIQQPKGTGTPEVKAPPSVELFDTWPKDTIQRFYFRALKPGDASLHFQGKTGSLDVPLEVLPWSQVLAPRTFGKIPLPRLWPLGEADYRHLKARRTCHTDDELKTLRESKAKPHSLAQQWLGMSDDAIWNIVPGPCVPRTCLIVLSGGRREDGRGKGCPVCGMKVYEGRSGFYPWRFDPKGHPWKVGCPSCGTWFPSNDWHKGDMHSGPFPDDGFGCEPVEPVMAPNGVPWRWPFIAYYHQWVAYMRTLTPGIEHCARAFALTGDRRYAHKAAVGLLRYAESMLDMAMNMAHRKMAYRDAILRWPVGAPQPRSGLGGTFLYIQPNWDTPRMEACARSWDLIFDQLGDDKALLDLCRRQHHPEIQTADDLRRFMEAGIIRVPLQACLDNAVARNYPMQEVTVATMALALDSPRALDLADWLLNDGAAIRFTLTNDFFKDGSACESESYNSIHIRDMERMFDLLERIRALYPDEWKRRGLVSPYDDPKYRLLYDFPIDNSLIGCTTTWTGDTGHSVAPRPHPPRQGWPVHPRNFLNVYRRTRAPRFAQALTLPTGKVTTHLRDPELRAEVEKIAAERGWQVRLKSNILDGYGHLILRSGTGDRQRALWLRYGRIRQHAHQDLLSMGLAALRRDMLPDLGYPQGWTYHGQWAANWGTHYGTHITGVSSRAFGRGAVTLFADTPPARVATVTATLLPGTRKALRSRTIALIDLDERDAYAITLERVLGGKEHTLSFHGPDGDATPAGLQLTPQDGGTVLGPNVKYGDVSPAAKVDSELACLAFLYDVQRAQPKGLWSIDCLLRDQKDVHLRATLLCPPGSELALAKGRPPQGKQAYEMTWAIVQRRGAAPLASQFLTVLEPYEGERLVRKIEAIPLTAEAKAAFKPIGIRVTTEHFVDTIILQPDEPQAVTTPDGLACDGEFGFWRERGGKLVAAVLAGGTTLRKGDAAVAVPPAYQGRVKSCDWPKRSLVVEPRPDNVAALVGRHVRIHNEAGSDASYLIEAAEPVEGGCRVTLPYDPRIGEGFVRECKDGAVVSATPLRFRGYWRYYAGKTLASADGRAAYRLKDVDRKMACVLDETLHGKVAAETLRAAFEASAKGRPRFAIYDYGPGDHVAIKHSVSVEK